jgi:hypothetical protein
MNATGSNYGKVVNTKRFLLILSLIITFGSTLTILVDTKYQNIIIALVGVFIFWLGPTVIFAKQFRNLFIRPITVKFEASSFSIKIFNKDLKLTREENIKYKNIRFFKAINSAKDDITFLKIKFKDGKRVAYSFSEDNEEDSTVSSLIIKHIQEYNKTQNANDRVKYAPPFFASKSGFYYIVGLIIIFGVAIILQILFAPVSLPFTFFASIILFLQIMAQRKRDLKDAEKFNNLD